MDCTNNEQSITEYIDFMKTQLKAEDGSRKIYENIVEFFNFITENYQLSNHQFYSAFDSFLENFFNAVDSDDIREDFNDLLFLLKSNELKNTDTLRAAIRCCFIIAALVTISTKPRSACVHPCGGVCLFYTGYDISITIELDLTLKVYEVNGEEVDHFNLSLETLPLLKIDYIDKDLKLIIEFLKICQVILKMMNRV